MTEVNIQTVAIVVAVLSAIIGLMYWGKTQSKGKKTRNMAWTIFAVAIVAIALVYGGILPATFSLGTLSTAGVTTETPTSTNQVGTVCAVEDTTVTLSAQDAFLSTAVGGTHRYRVNNAPALTVSDAGTLTASPGDKIDVLWMNGSLTGYYSSVDSYVIPCKGTYTPGPKNLYKNGTLSVRIFNTNGDLIDEVVTNQTLGAGDVKSLKVEVEESYQRADPYGYVLVMEYNKTAVDDVVFQANGVELQSASVPQGHASTYGTESVRKAYLLPEQLSNAITTYTVVIDADDTFNPTGSVKMSFFGRNYFINEKNGGAFEGPSSEDESNAVTRTGQQAATIWIS